MLALLRGLIGRVSVVCCRIPSSIQPASWGDPTYYRVVAEALVPITLSYSGKSLEDFNLYSLFYYLNTLKIQVLFVLQEDSEDY